MHRFFKHWRIVQSTAPVVAVLACTTALTAALAAECPVTIKKLTEAPLGAINKTSIAAAVMGNPDVGHVGIDYQNQSDKDVLTVRFGLGYVNTMRELSDVEFVDTKEHRLKPGKSFGLMVSTGSRQIGDQTRHVGWVEKVLFADGTYWNDDGSKSCATAPLQGAFAAAGRLSPQQVLAFTRSGEGSTTVISTYPSGAAVTVDGKNLGVTPLSFMLLRHGTNERVITLSLAGYKPRMEKRVPDGSVIVITATLEPEGAGAPEQKSSPFAATSVPPSTPEAATAQAAASSAKMEIVSTPEAAEIQIDDSFFGNTPSTIAVGSGEHTITLTKPGYKSWARKVKVTSGEVKINAELQRE